MPSGKGTSRHWNEEELKVLHDHMETHGPNFCSEVLSTMGYYRPRGACGMKAHSLGLYYQGLPKCRFKKGQTSHNKGKKMSAELYAKTAPTMFKKGCRVGAANTNYVPVGHETFRSDGYWWVKIAEKTWKEKHRLFWEQNNGPIPKGLCLIFKDGNPHNISLANLELITRAESLRRNRWGKGPSTYSLMVNRPAKQRLKKVGLTAKEIREHPELLQMAKKETLLKLKLRNNNRHDAKR